jgi:hypothetical protein
MSKTAGKEFAEIVGRELDRLSELIASYGDSDSLWDVTGDAQNPPGTLALHLVGNLEHYVGAVLGDTGYLRDRDAEFADRGVPREEILRRIASAKRAATSTLARLDDEALGQMYPASTGGGEIGGIGEGTTRHFLVHLMWHLGWHLGQIYYHRRLLSEPNTPG